MDGKIQEWYMRLPTQTLDLVGDYAGNELFLLEGDSLLLQCFADPKIKIEGKSVTFFKCFYFHIKLTNGYKTFNCFISST